MSIPYSSIHDCNTGRSGMSVPYSSIHDSFKKWWFIMEFIYFYIILNKLNFLYNIYKNTLIINKLSIINIYINFIINYINIKFYI